jgi:hypothetical protein
MCLDSSAGLALGGTRSTCTSGRLHTVGKPDHPVLRSLLAQREIVRGRTERRVGARSLGPAPSLSVMSYIDLAHAERRPVQRTGLGDRRRTGMPVDTPDERSADAGQIPPDLARALCGNTGCCLMRTTVRLAGRQIRVPGTAEAR